MLVKTEDVSCPVVMKTWCWRRGAGNVVLETWCLRWQLVKHCDDGLRPVVLETWRW